MSDKGFFQSNKKIVAIIGGLIALGGIYLLTAGKKTSAKNTREDVIRILKAKKRKLLPKLAQIVSVLQQWVMMAQMQGQHLGPEQLRELLNTPEVAQILEPYRQAETQIYQENGFTDDEFQQALQNFEMDEEIEKLIKQFEQMENQAFSGKMPDIKCQIPEFLTPNKLVEFTVKSMKSNLSALQSTLFELQAKGEPLTEDSPKLREIMMQIQNGSNEALLQQEGLENFEASGEQIVIYATMTYMQTNKDQFQQKFMMIQQIMQQIGQDSQMNPNLDPNKITQYLEQFDQILVKLQSGNFEQPQQSQQQKIQQMQRQMQQQVQQQPQSQVKPAQRQVVESNMSKSAVQETVDETGLDPKGIDYVVEHTKCKRKEAVQALRKHNGDFLQATLEFI